MTRDFLRRVVGCNGLRTNRPWSIATRTQLAQPSAANHLHHRAPCPELPTTAGGQPLNPRDCPSLTNTRVLWSKRPGSCPLRCGAPNASPSQLRHQSDWAHATASQHSGDEPTPRADGTHVRIVSGPTSRKRTTKNRGQLRCLRRRRRHDRQDVNESVTIAVMKLACAVQSTGITHGRVDQVTLRQCLLAARRECGP
jgi:hypothetical protein